MTDSLISRIESLLAQIEALEDRGTKGEWEPRHRFSCHSLIVFGEELVAQTACCSNQEALHIANAALIAFQRNHSKTEIALVRGLLKARRVMSDTFGGMGKGSAIWSNAPYDKGHTAGVLSALTAFDKEHNEFLTRWADSTEAELGKVEGR